MCLIIKQSLSKQDIIIKIGPYRESKPHEGYIMKQGHAIIMHSNVPTPLEGSQVIIIIEPSQKKFNVHQEGAKPTQGNYVIFGIHQIS